MIVDATPLARRNGANIELRSGPIRLRWELDGPLCSDGHSLRVAFAATVAPLDTPTERRMLQEALLADREQITWRDVVSHFQPTLREALERFVSARTVTDVLADAGRSALRDALAAAARAVAFNCGLEVVPPMLLEAQSPTLRQQQAEASARQQAEQRAARHVADMRQSAELFKEFQTLRQSSPMLSDGQALARFAPDDQAELLRALLLSGAAPGSDCAWAAAGPALVRITQLSPASGPPQMSLVPLPDRLGPLRSVQWAKLDGRPVILAGARTGIWIVDPEYAADAQPFENSGMTSVLGFNRARLGDGLLWASHGEAGLLAWDLCAPAKPNWIIAPGAIGAPVGASNGAAAPNVSPPAIAPSPGAAGSGSSAEAARGAPRFLQDGGDATSLFATGRRLCRIDRDGQTRCLLDNGPADIVGLVSGENHLAVVYADGAVCVLDRHNLDAAAQSTWTRPAGAITAAGRLPWLNSSRLLLATEDGPVFCIGMDDPVCTQFRSPHRGLRMVAGSSGAVAAVSADRQRLIYWNAWEPAHPAADIHVGAVARHRIADVVLGAGV